jgi:hypothetical protein
VTDIESMKSDTEGFRDGVRVRVGEGWSLKAAQIVNNREIKPFALYLFIVVVYWLCTYSMSRLARRMERRAQSRVILPPGLRRQRRARSG